MFEKIIRAFIGRNDINNDQTPTMTEEDRNIIVLYANGRLDFRNKALEVYKKYLPILGPRSSDLMSFMAEVDNPMPDLALRGFYRQSIINQYQPVLRDD